MIVSLTRLSILLSVTALLSGAALAQTQDLAVPPSDIQPAAQTPQPVTTPSSMGLALPPTAILPIPGEVQQKPATPQSVTTQPATTAPTSIVPVVAQPQSAPTPQPQTTTAPTVQKTETPAPVAAKIIEEAPLKDVKSDSIGLMGNTDGGLGAGLWKNTSRIIAERFMGMLSLPLPYVSLNNLAERLLLTTAGAPEGDPGNKNLLTSLRANRLVSLGHAAEAWKLINLAGLDQFEDADTRSIAEAALVSPAADDVCKKLPDLIKKHTAIEWQKLMTVCQLQAKDTKAAQVSLDLLHSQNIQDDVFYTLAEKNIIAGNKQLPHQLTPLKPLTVALLGLTDLPLRSDLYARPDTTVIWGLLKARANDEKARMALAERAAYKGIISSNDLADIYRSQIFTPDAIGSAAISNDAGPSFRALLYQASQQEKDPRNRIADALRFLASLETFNMGGGILTVMGDVLGTVQPDPAHNQSSADITRLYMLAGKGNLALAWLGLAQNAERGMPQVTADLQSMWPLLVLTGLESEKDFAKDLNVWLSNAIHESSGDDAQIKSEKAKAASLLLLMDAVGFPVTDEAWVKASDTVTPEKTIMPPALLMQRLRLASAAGRKGETILMGLLAATGGKEDPPILVTVEIIRALRSVGLTSDAGNLAKDVALRIIYPPSKI